MDHQTEILVIGGGAIGICCAFYLNRLGKQVTVLEKDDICSGSSHGNAGLVVPSHSIPLAAPGVIVQGLKWMFDPTSPFYIKPRLQRHFLAWLWKFYRACNQHHVRRAIPVLHNLSLASRRLFDELATLEGLDFGYEKQGRLELFRTPEGFKNAVREEKLLNEYGIESQTLQGSELGEFLGEMQTTAVGGIFRPLDGQVTPDRFVHQLALYTEKKGVRLLNASEVLGFEVSGRRVSTVKTTRGDISAEEIVLAAGCWSSELAAGLNVKLMIEPAKGYSITYKRSEAGPRIPLMLCEARVAVTPMDDMLRFAGTLELAGFDLSVDKRRVQAVLDAVPAYLPGLHPQDFELVEIWRGLRPCSPDGLPYIGRPRAYDNFIVAAGHGMLGISLAPITGKIISQLVAKQAPEVDPAALAVERFN